MQSDFSGTIWVDVEDFFDYFVFNPRPSGIQRLAFEIKRELQASLGTSGRLRFVRRGHGHDGPLLREVPWADLEAMIADVPDPMARPQQVAAASGMASRRRVQRIINGLPQPLREPLFRSAVLHSQAGRNWRELARALRRKQPAPVRAMPAAPPADQDGFAAQVRPGDHFLALGAPWAVPGFAEQVAELKRRHGLIVSLLLYDLIPVRHPEWCTKRAVALFESWLHVTLPLCDRLMAISRHTARDVESYARERDIKLACAVQPVPIGTGFGTLQQTPPDPRPAGLPQPGSYVLFVSTIEARKNHALVVRVWRRLVDEVRAGQRDAASVPQLVFAGRVGWLVADLMAQLDNMAWLGGRVRLVRDPSDAELRSLYEGCLFTIFPSFFEGWGLPVTESLAMGKPCLSSSATALPEAGGALGRYFDPEDTGSAHRAVVALLDQPGAVAAWQDQVRREFRPAPWADTAQAVLAHLVVHTAQIPVPAVPA